MLLNLYDHLPDVKSWWLFSFNRGCPPRSVKRCNRCFKSSGLGNRKTAQLFISLAHQWTFSFPMSEKQANHDILTSPDFWNN